jgi:hypothetical protein
VASPDGGGLTRASFSTWHPGRAGLMETEAKRHQQGAVLPVQAGPLSHGSRRLRCLYRAAGGAQAPCLAGAELRAGDGAWSSGQAQLGPRCPQSLDCDTHSTVPSSSCPLSVPRASAQLDVATESMAVPQRQGGGPGFLSPFPRLPWTPQ